MAQDAKRIIFHMWYTHGCFIYELNFTARVVRAHIFIFHYKTNEYYLLCKYIKNITIILRYYNSILCLIMRKMNQNRTM